ncbi:MAG: DUF3795 domain-containing protein [bacterium]
MKNDMPRKVYPTIACCGLDCGLCPRFYTIGPSRCPGCAGPNFFNKHPSCSYIACCVKKQQLEVCGECIIFPCSKFKPEPAYQQIPESSSYPSSKKIIPNLKFIRIHGIKRFIEQQRKRIKLLETMIKKYDDGRSKSFYCRAVTLLNVTNLTGSIEQANQKIKLDKIKLNDSKMKALVLKGIINDAAIKEGIELVKKR